jgi:hypothetical protein
MRIIRVILLICLFSCGLQDEKEIFDLATYKLQDSSTIVLQIKTGSYLGATTPDVTWINKRLANGQQQQIGKIRRWLDKGTISFEPLNDSLINIQFVDSMWHHASLYTVNLNQRIYPNDGLPYLEPKQLSR